MLILMEKLYVSVLATSNGLTLESNFLIPNTNSSINREIKEVQEVSLKTFLLQQTTPMFFA